jgi:hypothetical protein
MCIKSHRNHAATEFCVINTSVRYVALHSPRNRIPYPSKPLVDVLNTHISCRLHVQGQGINYMQVNYCSSQYVAKLSEKLKYIFFRFVLCSLGTTV